MAVQATPINVPVDAPGMLRISWIARDGAPVQEGDVVLRFDASDLELELADGEADLRIAELKIGRTQQENSAKKENLLLDAAVAEEELRQANRFITADDTIFSRHEILDSEIDRELAEQRAGNARSRSRTVEKKGTTQLELLEIEKSKVELKIRKARKGLASLEVRAPHGGMLVLQRNWRGERPRPGDQVWPGQKMAEIPDPSKMKVKAYVLEADAAGLKAGLEAEMTVEAHPGKSYPARVDRVDALAKKRHHNVPVQYFQATLIPDKTDPETMKPGQRVRGEILLEEHESALVVPPPANFKVHDADTVFLMEGNRLVPTTVVLGAHSLSRIQVVSGLAQDDLVALRDPRQEAAASFGGGSSSGNGPATPAGGMP
jgi:HlyD family secretion protein